MASPPSSLPEGLTFDDRRTARIGLPEAVLCEGKDADQITALVAHAAGRGMPLLLTRLEAARHAALPASVLEALDYDAVSRTAFLGPVPAQAGLERIGILSGGSSDRRVASEAARTLAFHGVPSRPIADVGVAGLWRLLEREAEWRDLPVLIVVAGMEGALFSVVGGLAPGVVIAVPTSNGYGVAAGGQAALHAALASCAPGVLAMNVDNGYGAAAAALRILRVSGQDAGKP